MEGKRTQLVRVQKVLILAFHLAKLLAYMQIKSVTDITCLRIEFGVMFEFEWRLLETKKSVNQIFRAPH